MQSSRWEKDITSKVLRLPPPQKNYPAGYVPALRYGTDGKWVVQFLLFLKTLCVKAIFLLLRFVILNWKTFKDRKNTDMG